MRGYISDFVLWLFAFLIFIVIGVALSAIRLDPERGGHHTGFITAVDQEGYFFPNYRVFVKTDNSSSQEDEYCVNRKNEKLGQQLKELSNTRQQVTIHYVGVRGYGLDLCVGEEITSVTINR